MGRALFPLACAILVASLPGRAAAYGPFAADLPCLEETCVGCHVDADGGSGCGSPPCLNAFGSALLGTGWGPELASLDSDGDGFTNGEELGDPTGTWVPGTAIECGCTSAPGSGATAPRTDADGDGVCCLGRDDDGDGTCEGGGVADCDDADPTRSPDYPEVCDWGVDADCAGLEADADPDCDDLYDRDGDGICPGGGFDADGDGTCFGERELDPVDCDDTRASVSPRAAEDCANGIDDDCDGAADGADSQCCSSDADCDDGDACTRDRCVAGVCASEASCFDAGADAGAPVAPPDAGIDGGPRGTVVTYGCGCRASASRPSAAALALLGVALLWRRRRGFPRSRR